MILDSNDYYDDESKVVVSSKNVFETELDT
jgi:hypothetical protein